MKRFAVIMAGGGGTRFWPLSRQNSPKQLLNLSGNDVMINETIKRLEGIVPLPNTYIVTGNAQDKPLRDVLMKEVPPENIFLEPLQRNTAPCILYSALALYKQYGDGVMCVFPSDHFITNESKFRTILDKCIVQAETSHCLLTIGIKPTFASTGYGYIRYGQEEGTGDVYKVDEFVEKPDFETAKRYIASGNYLWNSGMFIWRLSAILDSFQRYLPRVYDKMKDYLEVDGPDAERDFIQRIYPVVQSISIDYGIMERSNDVCVIPGDFGWNDVGSWDALGQIFSADKEGNIVKADYIGVDTRDCIVYGNDRLIAAVGLEGMIIVDAGDALLVCPKNKAQEVKRIVDRLKEQNRSEML